MPLVGVIVRFEFALLFEMPTDGGLAPISMHDTVKSPPFDPTDTATAAVWDPRLMDIACATHLIGDF